MVCICYTAETVGSLPFGSCVWGVTTFENQLYVGRASSCDIEIYDIVTLTLQRRLSVPGLGCINDMSSRPGSDVMYVVDNCHTKIHVIDKYGVRFQWSVSETTLGVSVLPFSSNALVTFERSSYLREYTPQGELVREILLPIDIGVPTYAIKMPDNRYLVTHESDGTYGLHRVCAVDEQGRRLHCFGGLKGSGE
jgi:hypothetical protein